MRHLVRGCLLAVPALLTGCGLTSVRSSQDWSGVTDARLHLACHVGNYGSGVLLQYDGRQIRVLTCAHLVGPGESVSLWFFDPRSGTWLAYDGTVVARTHAHRQDLALVTATTSTFHLPPQQLTLVESLADGTELAAALANVAFGAEQKPFVLEVPAIAHTASIASTQPDTDGSTSWRVPKVLLHGGLQNANSGSPVFRGNQLVGLVESSPAFAQTANGSTVVGVLVGAPQTVRAFLAP